MGIIDKRCAKNSLWTTLSFFSITIFRKCFSLFQLSLNPIIGISEIKERLIAFDNPKEILKVDDTIVGIAEGHYADCICVGVARWSVNMNIYSFEDKYKYDYEQFKGELEYDEYRIIVRDKLKECRKTLHLAEPCYVINTLKDLENCLF